MPRGASWFDKDRREGYAPAHPSRKEIAMAKVKISPDDVVALPKAVLEAHGIAEGDDVEVTGGRKEVRLTVAEPKRKLTVKEFLAMRPRYNGPPITDEMIRDAIDIEARRKWDEENSR
jgi:bifunctional DNA-binding transcriptional regulator/antitoxin component of YhaV-PrlF toxin-antitoxin module